MSEIGFSVYDRGRGRHPMTKHSRARVGKELGERFAELLRTTKHSHQLGVCAALEIPWNTHMMWMAAKNPSDDVADYQAAVLRGLDEQRRKDLDEIETAVEESETGKVATVLNMRKHRHESRFKRFYDDAAKVELSGPNGGPVQTLDLAALPSEQLVELVKQADDADDE